MWVEAKPSRSKYMGSFLAKSIPKAKDASQSQIKIAPK